jgi:hypothetical protein
MASSSFHGATVLYLHRHGFNASGQTYMTPAKIILSLMTTAIMGASCRLPSTASPVPVVGDTAALTTITGEWSGRYWSEEAGGRHGTISFELRGGTDTAYGEVDMTFAPSLRLYGGAGAEEKDRRPPCTTIDITIVRVQGTRIRGTLAPYWDPDCDCRTWTVFEGDLVGDRVSGTFSSRRESSGSPPMTGRWLVERRRTPTR